MRAIDGDSHFYRAPNLFERYTDTAYRDRTVRVSVDSSGRVTGLIVDNRPMRMADLDELMSACGGYGEKEEGRSINDFDLYPIASRKWQDMDLRIGYLDEEGFAAQVLHPTMGLLRESSSTTRNWLMRSAAPTTPGLSSWYLGTSIDCFRPRISRCVTPRWLCKR